MKKLLFGGAFLMMCLPVFVSAATWTTTALDSTGNVGQYVSSARGLDGFARIAYYDVTNTNLKFIQCTNADCSTKVVTTIDSTGVVGRYTSIAIGADGFARIAYNDFTNKDLKFVRCTNAACSTNVITTIDSTGFVGRYTSIAMGGDGFARISYNSYDDFVPNSLKFIQCTNADCSTRVTTVVDTGVDPGGDLLGDGTSLVIGGDGFARISYNDSYNALLKFAQCTNASCSTKNITIVDSDNLGLVNTGLSLGLDGFVRIIYYYGGGTLRFVQCTNADCSTKNTSTIVDPLGGAGQGISSAMGSDGFARIAYYDDTDGDLELLRCTNADCSTNTTETVDSAGTVGTYPSIFLDTDDVPLISYYDTTNADLKFAYPPSSPTLTITTTVTNDNGGTLAVEDFPLFVDGVSIDSGVATTTLSAGSYTISETEDPAYAVTYGGDCDENGDITMEAGSTYACTVTNDDIGPTLTVTTTITNDDGGDALVGDFPLTLDGVSITSGGATTTTVGAKTLAVTSPDDYDTTWGGDCAADGTLTMALNTTYACTLTADDVEVGGTRSSSHRSAPATTVFPVFTESVPSTLPTLTDEERTQKIEEIKRLLIPLMRQLILELQSQLNALGA